MGCASALGRPCRGACSHEERRDRVSVDTSARHRTTGLSPRFATLPSGGLNPRRAGVLLSRDTRSADARPMCISTFTPNPLVAPRVKHDSSQGASDVRSSSVFRRRYVDASGLCHLGHVLAGVAGSPPCASSSYTSPWAGSHCSRPSRSSTRSGRLCSRQPASVALGARSDGSHFDFGRT